LRSNRAQAAEKLVHSADITEASGELRRVLADFVKQFVALCPAWN
jgi:hypothetical protein